MRPWEPLQRPVVGILPLAPDKRQERRGDFEANTHEVAILLESMQALGSVREQRRLVLFYPVDTAQLGVFPIHFQS